MAKKNLIPPTAKISEMGKLDPFCAVIADILSIPEFGNETDVREDFVAPLLKALGYSNVGKNKNKIERNVFLKVPELVIGRKKKSLEQYSPDYVLSVGGQRKWVIDAKAPKESIQKEIYISQAFSYAIHREINAPFFVLCNGEELAIFNTSEQSYKPITVFKRYELDYRWQELIEMLSAGAFKQRFKLYEGGRSNVPMLENRRKEDEVTLLIKDIPIKKVIEPRKQASKIHHGTHPYFTKRAWNVVREYIEHFTPKGGVVLDPFGGAGVTAIEAVFAGRKGIHIDINPIANFMTDALAKPVNLANMTKSYEKILKEFEIEVKKIYLVKEPKPAHWFPNNVKLPKDADAEYLHQYFSPHQLAAMSLLRSKIEQISNKDLRKVFFLIFSAALVKCNISYHNTPRKNGIAGGGDAGFLKYYRFQIPKILYQEQDPVVVFKDKYKSMFKAKLEIDKISQIQKDFYTNLQVVHGSATKLKNIKDESVDYVFTDPPYGSKISYLDCSILWNSWLKLPISKEFKKMEVISGGSLNKSDEEYVKLLQQSLDEIYRVLKSDCWFSIVFASENPKFWHAIRDYSIKLGFEHVNTICQPSQRRTVKKNQNPLTVFKGELILNFRKRRSSRNVVGIATKHPPKQYVLNSAEFTIVAHGGAATLEQIMEDLVPKLWESGLLGAVSNEIDDITLILKESFDFNRKNESWEIKKKARLGCHIPLEARVKFYLLSCLNKARNEKRKVTIDEIIMEVMPFLRNGITPTNQHIISELRKIAESRDGMSWEIKMGDQLTLF